MQQDNDKDKKSLFEIRLGSFTWTKFGNNMAPLALVAKMTCPRRGIVTLSHWLHLYDFSLLCILRWLLKLLSTDDVYTHLLHLYDFSPSSFVFLKGTPYIFTEVIIYKILIHHHQVPNVVSCLLSVSNWEKKIEQMKMRVIGHWLNKLEKYWDKLAKGWKL